MGHRRWRLIRQHRPDWVLMDIKMKEMDGLMATMQIKAAFPEARIIIVTAYGRFDTARSRSHRGRMRLCQ